MSTAKEINVYPKLEHLFTANLITSETGEKEYTLEEIIQLALENNLDIQISKKDLELTEQELDYIISNYLPFLDFQALGTQINSENAFLGTAEQTISGSLSLQQILNNQQILYRNSFCRSFLHKLCTSYHYTSIWTHHEYTAY